MFFRETFSKNSKSPVLQLVENIRTDKGPRQKLVVSLGTKLLIPKEKRYEVACIVKDRLAGQQPLFKEDRNYLTLRIKLLKKFKLKVNGILQENRSGGIIRI